MGKIICIATKIATLMIHHDMIQVYTRYTYHVLIRYFDPFFCA